MTLAKDTYSPTWNFITPQDWINVNHPWRPNSNELSFFENCIQQLQLNSKSRVAVLGCTPEFRRILSSTKAKVDLIDLSENMYQVASLFCQPTPREKFIKSDWFSYLKNHHNHYDLVISDLIDRVLPTKDLFSLYRQINLSLKPKGVYLHRSHWAKTPHPTSIPPLPPLPASINQAADHLYFFFTPYCLSKNNLLDIKKLQQTIKTIILTTRSQHQKKILKHLLTNRAGCPINIYLQPFQKHLGSLNYHFIYNSSIKYNIDHNAYIETASCQKINLPKLPLFRFLGF